MTDSAIHRIRHLQTQRDELLERADLLAERCDILQAERDAHLSDLSDAREAAAAPAETPYTRISGRLFELDVFNRAGDLLQKLYARPGGALSSDDIDLRRLLKQIAEAPEGVG